MPVMMKKADKDWNQKLGIGGAPTRATTIPTDSASRKEYPIASGFTDYFPDAIAAIAHMSFVATKQHHADKPIHWDRQKSKDEADTLMRHFLQRGTRDLDGERHTTKMAWRALALLQKELELDKWAFVNKDEITACTFPIQDGPYCENCEKMATFQHCSGTHWCDECRGGQPYWEFFRMSPVGGTHKEELKRIQNQRDGI